MAKGFNDDQILKPILKQRLQSCHLRKDSKPPIASSPKRKRSKDSEAIKTMQNEEQR